MDTSAKAFRIFMSDMVNTAEAGRKISQWLVDELSSTSERPVSSYESSWQQWRRTSRVFEEDDRYVLEVDVPGVQKDDLDLQVVDDVLTIRATRNKEEWERSWPLSQEVDQERMSGVLKNGVLTVTLGKKEKRVKDITIHDEPHEENGEDFMLWRQWQNMRLFKAASAYGLEVDLPGVAPADLKIQVVERTLTISGVRRYGRSVNPHQQVWERTFPLAKDVDEESISAHLNNGVLWVTAPRKAKEARHVDVLGPTDVSAQAGMEVVPPHQEQTVLDAGNLSRTTATSTLPQPSQFDQVTERVDPAVDDKKAPTQQMDVLPDQEVPVKKMAGVVPDNTPQQRMAQTDAAVQDSPRGPPEGGPQTPQLDGTRAAKQSSVGDDSLTGPEQARGPADDVQRPVPEEAAGQDMGDLRTGQGRGRRIIPVL